MAVIRLNALEKLKDCLTNLEEGGVEDLADSVCAGPSEVGHVLSFPNMSIVPTRFEYEPHQASEWKCIGGTTVIYEVGAHIAQVTLRLGAATSGERALLEDGIVEAFMRRVAAPGILITELPDVYDAIVAWEYLRSEWDDSSGQDSKWYSDIYIQGIIPALVCRKGVYTIQQLRMAFTEDFASEYNNTNLETSERVEVVRVQQDGTVTPVN